MKDVQGELDRRNIPLKHVGIKDLRWPIALKDKEKGTQNTVATVSLAVDLPHDLQRNAYESFCRVPANARTSDIRFFRKYS